MSPLKLHTSVAALPAYPIPPKRRRPGGGTGGGSGGDGEIECSGPPVSHRSTGKRRARSRKRKRVKYETTSEEEEEEDDEEDDDADEEEEEEEKDGENGGETESDVVKEEDDAKEESKSNASSSVAASVSSRPRRAAASRRPLVLPTRHGRSLSALLSAAATMSPNHLRSETSTTATAAAAALAVGVTSDETRGRSARGPAPPESIDDVHVKQEPGTTAMRIVLTPVASPSSVSPPDPDLHLGSVISSASASSSLLPTAYHFSHLTSSAATATVATIVPSTSARKKKRDAAPEGSEVSAASLVSASPRASPAKKKKVSPVTAPKKDRTKHERAATRVAKKVGKFMASPALLDVPPPSSFATHPLLMPGMSLGESDPSSVMHDGHELAPSFFSTLPPLIEVPPLHLSPQPPSSSAAATATALYGFQLNTGVDSWGAMGTGISGPVGGHAHRHLGLPPALTLGGRGSSWAERMNGGSSVSPPRHAVQVASSISAAHLTHGVESLRCDESSAFTFGMLDVPRAPVTPTHSTSGGTLVVGGGVGVGGVGRFSPLSSFSQSGSENGSPPPSHATLALRAPTPADMAHARELARVAAVAAADMMLASPPPPQPAAAASAASLSFNNSC